jgi:hypothetical protein
MNINVIMGKRGRDQKYGESERMPTFSFVPGLISLLPIIEIARDMDQIDVFRHMNPAGLRFSPSLR